jgi:hypothetical protein
MYDFAGSGDPAELPVNEDELLVALTAVEDEGGWVMCARPDREQMACVMKLFFFFFFFFCFLAKD